ncbi:hypothetical protein [Altererythrobacter sp. MF3-039]|uniref:hypothetical protein n=1 Tax=Altererythrobacter sp. MF3-039 TaxID=3252901 RepID=UPI00390C9234
MIKKIAFSLAAASMAFTAAPVIAQDGEEEVRTTWELRFIDLAPGAEGEFLERTEKYYNPAREAAGMKPVQIHYLHNGDYDLLLVMDMPDGMASFDTHDSARRTTYRAALEEAAGGEEALKQLNESGRDLVEGTKSIFSHSHP